MDAISMLIDGGKQQMIWSRRGTLTAASCRLQESNTYGTGFTMRFPRIEKMREDKSWNQTDTVATLREKVQEMQVEAVRGKISKQPRQARVVNVKVGLWSTAVSVLHWTMMLTRIR